jgi:rhodanese-related sulfurtransferase
MNSILNPNFEQFSPDQIKLILEQASQRASDHFLEFKGTVLPQEAWALFQSQDAVIVDVRTSEERKFVGLIENTIHIPWAIGTALNRNPNFVEDLETKVGRDKLIFLICRSGKRSAAAANIAFNAGFNHVYNIDQGFEGDLNESRHRGTFNGWRFHHLPWIQE